MLIYASLPARKGILCVLDSSQTLSTSKQLSYPVLGQLYGRNPISNLNISNLNISNLNTKCCRVHSSSGTVQVLELTTSGVIQTLRGH